MIYIGCSLDVGISLCTTVYCVASIIFWNHVHVISSVDKHVFVYPYHANIPSFGEWGFVILGRRALRWDDMRLPDDVRFLTNEVISQLFFFSNDMRTSQAG